MRFAPQNKIKHRQPSKRIIAIAFLLCFVVGFFLSGIFFLTHVNHEHDHNGVDGSCDTCAQIQASENLIKQFGIFAVSLAFAVIILSAAIAVLFAISFLFGVQSPVKLKIRMNN